ncbi:hypothetical protein CRG98_019506 [Punica granatum]|uniref:Uncharacterized protein n=1 Tax=Punica granatum TaxID=22663 RepID=A0A2I0JUW0_PUNGR|nr:hypothetical protein CRG98_019506 [Punica granatum]
MAEENQLGVFEEDTPLTPIHSQAPTMHAPPPHVSPAGVPPAHQGASPTHFSPPASSGAHPAYSEGQPSSATDDRARIVVLESTVNQLAATMATNMTELMALLKSPNRASSSFTPPPGDNVGTAYTRTPTDLHASPSSGLCVGPSSDFRCPTADHILAYNRPGFCSHC